MNLTHFKLKREFLEISVYINKNELTKIYF